MNKETERLINELRKDLHALRIKVEQKGKPKLLEKYRELLLTLD